MGVVVVEGGRVESESMLLTLREMNQSCNNCRSSSSSYHSPNHPEVNTYTRGKASVISCHPRGDNRRVESSLERFDINNDNNLQLEIWLTLDVMVDGQSIDRLCMIR